MKIETPYVKVKYPFKYRYTFKDNFDEICNSYKANRSSEALRWHIVMRLKALLNRYLTDEIDLSNAQNFDVKYENEDNPELETDYRKINIIPNSEKCRKIWLKLLNSTIKL